MFALPEARKHARRAAQRDKVDWAAVTATIRLPRRLITTPGDKLAAISNNRLLYRQGVPVAIMGQGEINSC